MSEFLNSAGTKYLLEKIKNNYLSTADTSTITSLIGVDTTPTANSDNLITSGGVKGALDDKANSAHTHGFITSEGTITTNMAIANGDRLVFSDSSIGNQLVRHSLTFNGSTTSKALTQKGTFENVVNSVNGQSGAVTIDTSNFASVSEAISALSLTMDSEYKLTLSGRTADGSGFTVSDVIDLPLETMVVSGAYDSANTQIVLTLKNGSTTSFPVSALVDGLQSEITSQNTLSADLISDGTTNKVVTGTDKTNWNNAYASAHTHTNKSVLDGIAANDITNWNNAYASAHTHTNKTVLDGITDTAVTSWNNAASSAHSHSNSTVLDNLTQGVIDNSHTHSNKTALDTITTGKTRNWDNAYASAHTHSNAAVLNGISSTDVTNWNGVIAKTDSTTFGTHSATTIANGTSSQMHLPTVSASDNNKVLMVVNGVWTLVAPSMIYSGSGAPDNSQGNNGDLYIQTS